MHTVLVAHLLCALRSQGFTGKDVAEVERQRDQAQTQHKQALAELSRATSDLSVANSECAALRAQVAALAASASSSSRGAGGALGAAAATPGGARVSGPPSAALQIELSEAIAEVARVTAQRDVAREQVQQLEAALSQQQQQQQQQQPQQSTAGGLSPSGHGAPARPAPPTPGASTVAMAMEADALRRELSLVQLRASQLESTQAEVNRARATAEQSLRTARAELVSQSESSAALGEQLRTLRDELAQLQQRLDEARREAEYQAAEAATASAAANAARRDLESARVRAAHAEQMVAVAREEAALLRDECKRVVGARDAARSELLGASTENDAMRRELQEGDDARAQLALRIEQLQLEVARGQERQVASNARVAELEQRVHEHVVEREALQGGLASATRRTNEVEDELAGVSSELVRTQSELSRTQTELEQLRSSLEARVRALGTVQSALGESEAAERVLGERVRDLSAHLDQSHADCEALRAQLAALQRAHDDESAARAAARADADALRDALSRREAELRASEGALSEARDRLEHARGFYSTAVRMLVESSGRADELEPPVDASGSASASTSSSSASSLASSSALALPSSSMSATQLAQRDWAALQEQLGTALDVLFGVVHAQRAPLDIVHRMLGEVGVQPVARSASPARARASAAGHFASVAGGGASEQGVERLRGAASRMSSFAGSLAPALAHLKMQVQEAHEQAALCGEVLRQWPTVMRELERVLVVLGQAGSEQARAGHGRDGAERTASETLSALSPGSGVHAAAQAARTAAAALASAGSGVAPVDAVAAATAATQMAQLMTLVRRANTTAVEVHASAVECGTELAALRARCTSIETALRGTEVREHAALAELERVRAALGKSDAELGELRAAHDSHVRIATRAQAELGSSLERTTTERDALRERAASAEDNVRELRERLARLESNLDDATGELARQADRARILDAELAQSRALNERAVQSYEEQLADARDALLTERQHAARYAEELHGSIDQHRARLGDLQNEVGRLRSEVASLRSNKAALERRMSTGAGVPLSPGGGSGGSSGASYASLSAPSTAPSAARAQPSVAPASAAVQAAERDAASSGGSLSRPGSARAPSRSPLPARTSNGELTTVPVMSPRHHAAPQHRFAGEVGETVALARLPVRCTVLRGHGDAVTCAAFDDVQPARVVSGSRDRTVRVWDVGTGRCLHTLGGHSKGVTLLQRVYAPAAGERASAAPCLFASGSVDGTARIWNLSTGLCVRLLSGQHSGALVAAEAFGSWLFTADAPSTDNAVAMWDLESGSLVRTLPGAKRNITVLATVRASRYDVPLVVAGSADHSVRVWDLRSGAAVHTLLEHSAAVRALAVSGPWLCSAGDDCTVAVWDVYRMPHLAQRHTHLRGKVNALAFCGSSSDLLAAAATDGVHLLNLASGQQAGVLGGHTGGDVTCLAANDHVIVHGSAGGGGVVSDVHAVRERGALEGHQQRMRSVALRGNDALTCSDDGTVRLWHGM
jgi:WD40 repeat protein